MKTQKIQVKIRIPREAAQMLETRAKKRGMSLKGYIVFLLAKHCGEKTPGQPSVE